MGHEEERFIPYRLTSMWGHRVLVLAPHPDDESLGCGGTLIQHRQHDDPVKIVFLTDGAQGATAANYTPEAYVALREEEAQQACRILGITEFEFWRIPDRACQPNEDVRTRMAQLLETYRPTLVYVPSPHEFHPDHRGAARLFWETLQQSRFQVEVAFYEINRPFKVNTLVDISAVVEQKRRACNTYQSQLEHLPYTELALSLNRFRSLTVSASCTYAEGFLRIDASNHPVRSLDTLLLEQFFDEQDARDASRPLVSVVVRTQNRPTLLRQALLSLVAQTYRPLEVIVVNDGGRDIKPVIEEVEPALSIQLCSHKHPRGRAAAANAGLAHAHGTFLMLLDDDDLLYPSHIDKLATHLVQSEASFAYSDCEVGHYRWENNELILTQAKYPFVPDEDGTSPATFDRDRLYRDNYIPLMTALFTRGLLDQVGLFDEAFEVYEDWDLWLRMARRTRFHRVPGITAEYRQFDDRPGHDFRMWRGRLYAKHSDYWTTERLTVYAWSLIESLQQHTTYLEEQRERIRRHPLYRLLPRWLLRQLGLLRKP